MDASGQVRRVIFRSFHGQYAFWNDSLRRGALWDMIYNAACEMAGVEVQKHIFFEYRAMVTQDRADSSLRAMVGNVPDHNMWKALQRRESDGVLLDNPPAQGNVPSTPGKGSDSGGKHGRCSLEGTKRRVAEAPPTKAPPAKKKLSTCQSTYLASDKHRAAIDKGNATKKEMLESKYQAFMGSYTVRRLLANRGKGPVTPEAAKALSRIDRIVGWHDAGEGKRLSTDLCQFVPSIAKPRPRKGYPPDQRIIL
ncbi:hypothetical protein LRP88_11841 [Fusarium phalaenopsidis]